LLSTTLERIEQCAPAGRYDPGRPVTVDEEGRPILEGQDSVDARHPVAGTETETRVRRDPGDPANPSAILAASTITKTRSDPPEPPDPATGECPKAIERELHGDFVGDDLATGLVAF
jgi:hypothetical protein